MANFIGAIWSKNPLIRLQEKQIPLRVKNAKYYSYKLNKLDLE